MDIQKNLKEKVSSNVSLWRGNLEVLEKKISSENIKKLSNNVNFKLTFLA